MTMHATLNRDAMADQGEARFPDFDRMTPPQRRSFAGGAYGEGGPNWIAIATIVGIHIAALVALVKLDIISIEKPAPRSLVVFDIVEPTPPPLMEKPRPEKLIDKVVPQAVAPVAIVPTPAPTPPIAVTTTPPPPKLVAVVPTPAPAPGPVMISDLADPISRPPFTIPLDVRRKGKGERTVVVRLTIGTDGQVEQSALAQSSGSDQLDEAIVKWVKRWRFRPVMRDGVAVQARANAPISINIT